MSEERDAEDDPPCEDAVDNDEDDEDDEYAGQNIYGYLSAEESEAFDRWLDAPVIGPPLAVIICIRTGKQLT